MCNTTWTPNVSEYSLAALEDEDTDPTVLLLVSGRYVSALHQRFETHANNFTPS